MRLIISIIGVILSLPVPESIIDMFVTRPWEDLGPNELALVNMITTYVLLHIFIMPPMLFLFTNALLFAFKRVWRYTENRKPPPNTTGDMINHVRNEYGVKLDDDGAAVLVWLLCGKDTLRQLKQYTGMHKHHIRYLIKMLRKKELIDPTKIAPVASLGRWADGNDTCGESSSS